VIALSSFISPYRADRDNVRQLHEEAGMAFIEIYVDCPIEEAEKRDPKGLYKKAPAGETKNFTGIHGPDDAPANPESHRKTADMTLEQEVQTIIDYLDKNGFLTGN